MSAAEVVFTESPRGGSWTARLLAPDQATGSILGRPVAERSTASILTIREVRYPAAPQHGLAERVRYEWTTPGERTHNGNRHGSALTLSEAQAAVIRWASRRFRVAR